MLPGQKYTPEQIARLAWTHRWHLIVPCAVLAALGALVANRIPNRYRSETVILVVPQRVPEGYVKATVTSRIEDRLPTISQQILSRTRLERIITDLNLYKDTRRTALMEDVVARMRQDIDVQVIKGDSFHVAYIGEQSRTVAEVTNRLASLFIEENLRDREVIAEGTNQFLESELEGARTRLLEHERKLESYRREHGGELPTQLASNLQVIQSTQMQIQSVIDGINRNRDRRLVLEQSIADASQPDPAVVSAPAPSGTREDAAAGGSLPEQLEAARATLRQLLAKLTDQHPDVIRARRIVADIEERVAAEASSKPTELPAVAISPAARQRQNRVKQLKADLDSVDRQIATGEAEEARLRAVVAEYQRRADAAPTRESELTELMRDYSTLQTVYSSLLQKREDSKMAANLERRQIGEQFKLLDLAKPAERPFEPNRTKMVLIAAAAGLILGLGFVAFREYRKEALTTEGQAQSVLGLPVLATVPLILTRDERRRERWLGVAVNLGCSGLVAVCAVVVVWVIGVPRPF